MLFIIFLVLAIAFFALKFGLFGLSLNINIDLFYFKIQFLKLVARISPVTIFLTAAWFTGLNKIVNRYVMLPVWLVLLIIFIVLPSLFEMIFGKKNE